MTEPKRILNSKIVTNEWMIYSALLRALEVVRQLHPRCPQPEFCSCKICGSFEMMEAEFIKQVFEEDWKSGKWEKPLYDEQ